MEGSVWAGCRAGVTSSYTALPLSDAQELVFVQDVPLPSLKHVIAGAAEPAKLDEPESSFGAQVGPTPGLYLKVHCVSREGGEWVARLPELLGKKICWSSTTGHWRTQTW